MTAFAIATKATIVLIVGRMTTETIARQLHFVGRLAVTIGALRFRVFTGQRKLCF